MDAPMFTEKQMAIIPLELRDRFLILAGRGMRPTKAASKLGIVLSQHDAQLIAANPENVGFAISKEEVAGIYSDTNKGQSCMSGWAECVAYVYATIGAQVAYNSGARVVVNPVSKTFGRVYGEKSSDLYYTLLALGYSESDTPLAGLSGNLPHKTVKYAETVYTDVGHWWENRDIIVGHCWAVGDIINNKGKLWRVERHASTQREVTILQEVRERVIYGHKTVYKAPSRFYLDGNHSLGIDQGKLIISGGGYPGFIDFSSLPRRIPECKVYRKINRKGLGDIAYEIERRTMQWKY